MKHSREGFFSFVKKINNILTSHEKKKSLIFFAYMLIAMILETAGIGLIIPVIEVISDSEVLSNSEYIQSIASFVQITSYSELINFVITSLVLVFLIKNIFLGYSTWYKINFISILKKNLSDRLFDIYLSQPYTFHLKHNSGNLIHNVSSEVNMFTGRLLNSIVVIASESLILLGIVILLFIVDPLSTLLIFTILGFLGWLIIYSTRTRTALWGKDRQYHESKKIQHLQQGLGGIKDVLFLSKELYFLDKFRYHNNLGIEPNRKQGFLQELPRLWFEVLMVLGLAITIYIANSKAGGIENIFVVLGVFVAAAFRIMPSTTRIIAALQAFRFSYPVLKLLDKEFKRSKIKALSSRDSLKKEVLNFSHELSFNKVSYYYPETKKKSLDNISLNLCKGQCIGIIGGSGAGKTTFIDILLGLLQPSSGNITVDNKDIAQYHNKWQEYIGYVPQTIFLTDNSIRKNIAFGVKNDEIDDSRIKSVIKDVQLSDYINNLPDGIDTFVGERGVRLSGGQKQRIGIARALYNNPEILVLDEATSSLDSATEERIMNTVNKFQKDKTIVIVAHRLSTVKNCDRLYRFSNGRLVEEGCPSDLL